jgi:hypothetical protein
LASEIKELLQDLFKATQILVNEKVLEALGLITTSVHGRSLAESLGKSSIVLMRPPRGYGGGFIDQRGCLSIHLRDDKCANSTCGYALPYFLSAEEALLADELHNKVLARPWDFWKSKLEK